MIQALTKVIEQLIEALVILWSLLRVIDIKMTLTTTTYRYIYIILLEYRVYIYTYHVVATKNTPHPYSTIITTDIVQWRYQPPPHPAAITSQDPTVRIDTCDCHSRHRFE